MVGRQNSQRALHASFPIQWSQFLRKGDRSFQVIWRKDLDVNLKTQNYCIELWALYLLQMMIQIQYYFDNCVSLCGSCSVETMPSHGPHGKSLDLLQNYSLPVCEKSFLKKGICYLQITLSNSNIFTWKVRRALNAISYRNKTKTLLCEFSMSSSPENSHHKLWCFQ